jgi:hypothetical protein
VSISWPQLPFANTSGHIGHKIFYNALYTHPLHQMNESMYMFEYVSYMPENDFWASSGMFCLAIHEREIVSVHLP